MKKDEKSSHTKAEKQEAAKEAVPAAPAHEEETKKLQEALLLKEKEKAELTDMLKRVQAEFINYRNRSEKEMQACRLYAEEDLVKKLLPLLDSFGLALKATENHEKFVKGVELIYAQFFNMLRQEGLAPIEALGKRFDPYMHEVLMKGKSDKGPDTVIEEFQKGYMFREKVLRHSKVRISE